MHRVERLVSWGSKPIRRTSNVLSTRPGVTGGWSFSREHAQYASSSIALAGFQGSIEAKASDKCRGQLALVEMVALFSTHGLMKHVLLACDFESLRMAGEHVITVGPVKNIGGEFAREV